MPLRSRVQSLPARLRADLDRRLVASGFSNYRAHSEWLAGEGHEISRSSLQAHGARLRELVARYRPTADEAGAVLAAGSEDRALVAAAGLRIVQDRLFEWLMDADKGDLKGHEFAARMIEASARAAEAIEKQRPGPARAPPAPRRHLAGNRKDDPRRVRRPERGRPGMGQDQPEWTGMGRDKPEWTGIDRNRPG